MSESIRERRCISLASALAVLVRLLRQEHTGICKTHRKTDTKTLLDLNIPLCVNCFHLWKMNQAEALHRGVVYVGNRMIDEPEMEETPF